MSFVGRSPSLGSKSPLQARRAMRFMSDCRIFSLTKALRLLQLAIAGAAFSALTACGTSATSQTIGTNPSSGGTTAIPAVNLVAMKSKVAMGTPATLQWSAKDAQSCTASGGWSGTEPTSGTATTDPLTASTTYVLTCTGPGGSASQSAEVVVTSPAPTVTLAASPATIANGGMSTLSWSSENATACTAAGGWRGAVAMSGTWSTGALPNTTDYELTCTGAGGSATQSATVTVAALPPVVTQKR